MDQDSQVLEKLTEEYHLEIDGVKFWAPYWINWETPPYFKDAPLAGKGTPEQITKVVKEKLVETGAVAKSGEDYRRLMRSWGLGIDCSGFASYLLSNWLKQTHGLNLADHLYVPKSEILEVTEKPSWKKAKVSAGQLDALPESVPVQTIMDLFQKPLLHLVNVTRLTSEAASVSINRVSEMKPGDMIKMSAPSGEHIALVLAVSDSGARCVDSRETRDDSNGISFAQIKFDHPDRNITEQTWVDSKGLGSRRIDKLCRLKVLDGRD